MTQNDTRRRPIRIGGASGGYIDRRHAIPRMARTAEVDVIVGDWMAEVTMTVQGAAKAQQHRLPRTDLKDTSTLSGDIGNAQFVPGFLDCFEPAIADLKRNGIKLAVNAGGSDTEVLAHLVKKMCIDRGHPMNVAWIEGDDVIEKVKNLRSKGQAFRSLNRGKDIYLKDWGFEPVAAQAYLGGLGIAEAFRRGADIVICGRVADAAPNIGAAAWWHGWDHSNMQELAGALISGHLVECGGYVTGGNFCGFKKLLQAKKHLDIGFPVVEVDHKGGFILTKEKNTGGLVDVLTATSQLVYEIQGPIYYNSDVTADIEHVQMEQVGEDRVRVWGVKGLPPPPTTKVGITADAGYQAEYHVFFVGLDAEEKAQWTEDQVREALGDVTKELSLLEFRLNGTSPVDAPSQDAATVNLRIVAQGRDIKLFDIEDPNSFSRQVQTLVLQSAPGASISNDNRLLAPKSFQEYFVSLFPQTEINQKLHLLFSDKESIIDIEPPTVTHVYPRQQKSYPVSNPVDMTLYETVRAPLGYVAMARSGDKSTDANVGLFVQHNDEWEWLRSLLTTEKIKEMLRAEYKGKPIDRFELPHIRCVHFLLHDHLERGYSSTASYDSLGKNVAEYLRAYTVDVPRKFLDRGRV